MAKKMPESSSSSSLSPPPEEVVLQEEASATKLTAGPKRKAAETTVKLTKRTKVSTVEGEERKAPKSVGKAPKKTGEAPTLAAKPPTAAVYIEETIDQETEAKQVGQGVKIKKTTTTRKKKQVDLEPLAERTADSKVRIGAHVSIAGGVHNAVPNSNHIAANAFALFMKNQRKWQNPPLDPEHARLFIEGCKQHGIKVADCCVPHGSYLVNLAHPDPERKKQAYDSFHDDLLRCAKLGIKLYNFHPGNANATTREEGIRLIAENINQALSDAKTGDVVVLLETMATLGNTIGGTFEDIAAIIGHVENKARVGVCLDTCHVFAAGYDLRTPEAYATTMTKFDEVIGLTYLKALHVNDSKAPFDSNRDLHAQIGTGYLGLRAFHNLVNDERLHGLPMILETPVDVVGADGKKSEDKSIWAREIKMLENLVGMDVESDEFKDLEARLQDEGKEFREKTAEQFERKQANEKKAQEKPKVKKKAKAEEVGDEDEGVIKPKQRKARVIKKKVILEASDEDEDEDEE